MDAALTRRAMLAAVGGAAVAACGRASTSEGSASSSASASTAPPSTSTAATPSAGATAGSARGSVAVLDTVATGFDVPWGLARLPDGSVVVTSRDDHHVYRVDLGSGRRTDLGEVPGVVSSPDTGSEGGLLGVAVSPSFRTDRRLYLYWTTASDNRIGWVRYDGGSIGGPTVIVDGIPAGIHHNGGRLAFGPDGHLYVGTGETGDPSLAQDRTSLGGKVLRMTPAGDPVGGTSLVFSYGHRNVQGLAFDAAGRLWASEFGDQTADELNWIRRGHNYGWPDAEGRSDDRRFTNPVAQWGTDEDSPSGIAIAAGCIWMAALQGERLWRIPLAGTKVVSAPTGFLTGRYGRLRSVLALDDQTLLVGTSNRDGRADPRSGDDRLLRLRVS